MPIRKEDDALSRATLQEKNYFKRRDYSATTLDFNRFIFMTPGTKSQYYDWRLNFDKQNLPSIIFKIDQQKYVNRPDNVSSAVYGTAKYWWIIAMANDIKDPFTEFTLGKELTVPDINHFKSLLGL